MSITGSNPGFSLYFKIYKMEIIDKYILKKDLPNLKKGVIFEHRKYDSKHPDRGNYGHGCLILGWLNGHCQDNWCGETYVFPGQLANNTEWFEKLETTSSLKDKLLKEIEILKKKIIDL